MGEADHGYAISIHAQPGGVDSQAAAHDVEAAFDLVRQRDSKVSRIRTG